MRSSGVARRLHPHGTRVCDSKLDDRNFNDPFLRTPCYRREHITLPQVILGSNRAPFVLPTERDSNSISRCIFNRPLGPRPVPADIHIHVQPALASGPHVSVGDFFAAGTDDVQVQVVDVVPCQRDLDLAATGPLTLQTLSQVGGWPVPDDIRITC